MRPKLHKQISWTLAGNVVFAASQWGMLIVLAKTVSPAMVGQFGLGLAIAAPVFMFANLQLRSIQATGLSTEIEFGDYLGYRLISTLVAMLAILGVAVWAGYGLSPTRVILAVGIAEA